MKKFSLVLKLGKNLLTFSNERDFDPWQACVKYEERTTFLKDIKNCTGSINVQGSEHGLLNQSALV
jgi:hypothetical protein